MGGKNSMWNKPLGTGKQSVAHNPLNIVPAHSSCTQRDVWLRIRSQPIWGK